MEIKAAPVPSDLRFASQIQSAESPTVEVGVPWLYVALLCGGCILVTIAAFHIHEKRKQRGGLFNDFRPKIE
jgi:hypothetical protein